MQPCKDHCEAAGRNGSGAQLAQEAWHLMSPKGPCTNVLCGCGATMLQLRGVCACHDGTQTLGLASCRHYTGMLLLNPAFPGVRRPGISFGLHDAFVSFIRQMAGSAADKRGFGWTLVGSGLGCKASHASTQAHCPSARSPNVALVWTMVSQSFLKAEP